MFTEHTNLTILLVASFSVISKKNSDIYKVYNLVQNINNK